MTAEVCEAQPVAGTLVYMPATPQQAALATIETAARDLLDPARPLADRVADLNAIRRILHDLSPFAAEPVDYVEWVSTDEVQANDYNPNTVAPPEMELLRISIAADGYTQPIVSPDEVLRLCQVAGLAELFADDEFSASWDVIGPDQDTYEQFEPVLSDAPTDDEPDRVYHTWDKWEALKAGFFDSTPRFRNLTADRCKAMYAAFLRDLPRFRTALDGVLRDWPNSVEHNLTNERMNRIAWLGQAAMCWDTGIPAAFCNGFSLLTPQEQEAANRTALEYLNKFLVSTGRDPLPDLVAAERRTQPELY